MEVLHSNERPNITAVYGTSAPPSGISGVLRRLAFRYSESNWFHWLTLILADRINVYEGLIQDVVHGKVPNVYSERGIKADWKFNKKAIVQKVIVNLALVSAILIFMTSKNKNSKRLLKRMILSN